MCFSSLTALTTLFYFTTIEIKYLTMLAKLVFFTDETYYAVLLLLLLKLNILLRSLSLFSALNTLTTLFYFTTIKTENLNTPIKLFFVTDYTHYTVLLSLLFK